MSLILAVFINAIVFFALMELFSAKFSSAISLFSVYLLVVLIHLHLFAGFVAPAAGGLLLAVPVSVLAIATVVFGRVRMHRSLLIAVLFHVAILGVQRGIAAAHETWPWLLASPG